MSNVTEQVIKLVSEHFGLERDAVKPDSKFVDDLGADSLEIVSLLMNLEDEFSIDIPDEEAEKITTLQEAIDYINRTIQ